MTNPQILIFAILAAMMGLFLWGRFRHDVVALATLLTCVISGLVPSGGAFAGFGHPAVITVACVLVLSQGLRTTGAVDWLARSILPSDAGRITTMLALIGLGAALSGFMNNVGAMALLMPIAVQLSDRLDLTPGQILMPLAFGTILGGMTTLVGTPPNLIVSGFREEAGRGQFAMFDFAPVGIAVATLGVLFVAIIGWRLVPARKSAAGADFDTGTYLSEAHVPKKSKAVGLTLRGFETEIEDSDAQIVGLVRNEVRITAPHGARRIKADDILVLESDVDALAEALSVFDIELEAQKSDSDGEDETAGDASEKSSKAAKSKDDKAEDEDENKERDEDIVLQELAILPGATIVGRSASDLRLRTRYGLNLLAVSREGRPPRARLRKL
ncbi:SLC13 family permease, partial [Roseovarius sp.]|uniref:SLC13 family permease n=1 Tax=Roseovarius sp. TaxID=1486281 RepID=UPI0035625F9F